MTLFSGIVYRLFLFLYLTAIRLYALFNPKAKKWIEGRKKHTPDQIPPKKLKYRLWIHAASLGEFEQGRPLIEMIRQQRDDIEIVLSFFSPSGFEVRKNYPEADYITYLPLDGPKRSRSFIQHIKPDLAVFIKYDIWYYYFKYLKQDDIPLIMVSSVFNRKHLYFKKYAGIFANVLNYVSYYFVQNKSSLELLNQHGFENATVISDTRIDRVHQLSLEARQKQIDIIREFKGDQTLLLLGSSYETEEEWTKELIVSNSFNGKLIIAPHNVNEGHIKQISGMFPEALLWTKIENQKTDTGNARIIIINTIGLLQYLYNYADIAFIGGGFNHSIHNTLEPATFGIPIIFGPKNHEKFPEAITLVQKKGAFLIKTYDDLKNVMEQLADHKERELAGRICKAYIEENIGGTETVYKFIDHMIK